MAITTTCIRRRTRAAVLALMTITAAGAAAATGPAASALSSTTCTGTSQITYTPGLTNTPQTVQYNETDTFSSCLSSDPTLTSGLFTVTVDLPGASCLALPTLTPNTPYPITWNNGNTSLVSLSFTDVIAEGIEQVTGTGPINTGEFRGANATIIWLYTVPNPLQCLTRHGITSQAGTLVAQITGV